MIAGLEKFRSYFQRYADQYVIIGGAACSILMEEVGLSFRSTKDMDIVIVIDPVNPDFIITFRDFIRSGNYEHHSRSGEKDIYYRFSKPREKNYPDMIEIFSAKPTFFENTSDFHIVPVRVDNYVISLSAILLDENYSGIVFQGARVVDGISVLDPEYLILLKAKAWLDMTKRTSEGHIDSRDIKKHRNDILRLSQIVEPSVTLQLSDSIRKDMLRFIDNSNLKDVDLKSLGMMNISMDEILNLFENIYSIRI